jgi:mannose/fructose/N-acetylgalactosamine-specific phosphotransferase system component IIB
MELFAIKTSSGFIPEHDSDYEKAKKIKKGESVKISVTRPRNYEFHKKFFALVRLVHHNQDIIEEEDDLRLYMIMKAGYVKKIETKDGLMYLPKSISFAKMDEIEFQDLYNKVIDVAIKILGTDRKSLLDEVINFM